MSPRRRLLPSLAGALAVGLVAPLASASPSLWAQARNPALAQREALLAEAESFQIRYRRIDRLQEERADLADLYLRRARELLEQAGAATSPDPLLRFKLAEVTHLLRDDGVAVKLLESVVHADNAPDPIRSDAYSQLAEAYTRIGRYDDEIKAYDAALSLEPHSFSRARLLANRAESFMSLGNTEAAIQGYRESLSLLGSLPEWMALGPTTLWGLGVALDRSGDLESGLEAIRIARTYDAGDKKINGPGWFYVPSYDRYWYQAIGHWSAARHAELGAARAEHYGRAVGNWEEYLENAPPDDRWAPIARARLKACEKERDARLKRTGGPAPPRTPRPPAAPKK